MNCIQGDEVKCSAIDITMKNGNLLEVRLALIRGRVLDTVERKPENCGEGLTVQLL